MGFLSAYIILLSSLNTVEVIKFAMASNPCWDP